MIAIDESTIQSFTLYDESEAETGTAEMIDPDRWHCEFRWAEHFHTFEACNVYAAWTWLDLKRQRWMPNGKITAIADFEIDFTKDTQSESAIITIASNPQDRVEGAGTDPGV
jgi:hypothetical protein